MSQTTKRALEASLKKLLLQKPLNKITINDITEDCGVNRMTFYYHFKNRKMNGTISSFTNTACKSQSQI